MFWRIIRTVRWRRKTPSRRTRAREYLANKEQARALARKRLELFNSHYNFKIGKMAIRNQKSRWGSCSKKGNLNFNYRVALLPANLADYVIVHELCHIGEFNHSRRFWALMSETLPDWRARRRELKSRRMK